MALNGLICDEMSKKLFTHSLTDFDYGGLDVTALKTPRFTTTALACGRLDNVLREFSLSG